MRSWGASRPASAIAGAGLRLRGAGPVPVLQHHLPGRGGLDPLGLPGGRPLAPAGPAGGPGRAWRSVLAMQVLGGDPESAYLIGPLRRGVRGRPGPGRPTAGRRRIRPRVWVAMAVVGVGRLGGDHPDPGRDTCRGSGPSRARSPGGRSRGGSPRASCRGSARRRSRGRCRASPGSRGSRRRWRRLWGLAGLVLLARWRRAGSAAVAAGPEAGGPGGGGGAGRGAARRRSWCRSWSSPG